MENMDTSNMNKECEVIQDTTLIILDILIFYQGIYLHNFNKNKQQRILKNINCVSLMPVLRDHMIFTKFEGTWLDTLLQIQKNKNPELNLESLLKFYDKDHEIKHKENKGSTKIVYEVQ